MKKKTYISVIGLITLLFMTLTFTIGHSNAQKPIPKPHNRSSTNGMGFLGSEPAEEYLLPAPENSSPNIVPGHYDPSRNSLMDEQIVYVGADGALRKINALGWGETLLLSGLENVNNLSLSSDKKRIAFAADGSSKQCLYKFGLDDLAPVELICGFESLYEPRWSRDDAHITFAGQSVAEGNYDIWVTNTNSGDSTRLVSTLLRTHTPDWLNNDTIIFAGEPEVLSWNIYKIKISQPEQPVPIAGPFDPGGCGADPRSVLAAHPTLSPNGKRLAFIVGVPRRHWLWGCNGFTYQVFLGDADGQNVAQLAEIANHKSYVSQDLMRWAPNGQSLGVLSGSGSADLQLRIVKMDGTVSSFSNSPTGAWSSWDWSPDSKWIVAGHLPVDAAPEMHIVDVDALYFTPPIHGSYPLWLSEPDSDRDGLPDDWEINGISGIDLPAMGADPHKKDIFVEVYWMEDSDHSHKPEPEAIKKVVDAFANSEVDGIGINLHVDVGPDSIDHVTGNLWGEHARGSSIPHIDVLGENQPLKDDLNNILLGFTSATDERLKVFHYALFAHEYNSGGLGCLGSSSGFSFAKDGIQVFGVTLGCYADGIGSANQQAGSFMHELGHNLGLRHGGNNESNHKPNYLSVMNYSFQLGGLIINGDDGHYDYSHFDLPDLDESNLSESGGLKGGPEIDDYGTKFHITPPWICVSNSLRLLNFTYSKTANGPVNWDCSIGIDQDPVQEDTNNDGEISTLESYNDWDNLNFKSGQIGAAGAPVPFDITQEMVDAMPGELTFEEDQQIARIPKTQYLPAVLK